MSLFKCLVFNNSSGSSTHFSFFRFGGPEGWTEWRLADPAVRLPGFGSRMVTNLGDRRPRRLGIHFEISLATECRLPYPGPFVKRKRARPNPPMTTRHVGGRLAAPVCGAPLARQGRASPYPYVAWGAPVGCIPAKLAGAWRRALQAPRVVIGRLGCAQYSMWPRRMRGRRSGAIPRQRHQSSWGNTLC